MTRDEQRLHKAIKMLEEEYSQTQSNVLIHKPLARALYNVWRYFDANENDRSVAQRYDIPETDEFDKAPHESHAFGHVVSVCPVCKKIIELPVKECPYCHMMSVCDEDRKE